MAGWDNEDPLDRIPKMGKRKSKSKMPFAKLRQSWSSGSSPEKEGNRSSKSKKSKGGSEQLGHAAFDACLTALSGLICNYVVVSVSRCVCVRVRVCVFLFSFFFLPY